MSNVKIYHQCGYRFSWNFEIFREKSIGDGFILSPINMNKNFLSEMSEDELSESFFDPQFYALGISKEAYLSYGFDYIDNLLDFAKDRNYIAERNINYQNSLNIKYLTIPTIDFDLLNSDDVFESVYLNLFGREYDGNNNNNLNILNELIIRPFTEYIKKIETDKKVLLTVIFDENIARNSDRFYELITMITSYDNIDGIYLIPKCSRTYKRIENIQFLLKIMELIKTIKNNNMEVIVGNSDIESILYVVAGADAISIGIYENLRYYDGNRFIDSDEIKRSPVPRMFSYKLLQWIDYNYLFPISEHYDIKDIFDDNEYFDITQKFDYKWHFMKPEPYKHYMISYCKILNKMPNNMNDRIEYVNRILQDAQSLNTNFIDNGIILDENSGGSHLGKWITVLLQFKE
ncbi:MAG: hypothetical protein GX951_01350 [Mollicutes bacterium]|nr:hypothetical protein [Mollicutes bacterium]